MELAEIRWPGLEETGRKATNFGAVKRKPNMKMALVFLMHGHLVTAITSCTPIASKLISTFLPDLRIFPLSKFNLDTHPQRKQSGRLIWSSGKSHKGRSEKNILIVLSDHRSDQRLTSIGLPYKRGLRVLEFSHCHGLTIASSLHPHKESRTVTLFHNHVHNQVICC